MRYVELQCGELSTSGKWYEFLVCRYITLGKLFLSIRVLGLAEGVRRKIDGSWGKKFPEGLEACRPVRFVFMARVVFKTIAE